MARTQESAEGIALVRAAGQGPDLPSLAKALEPHRLALLGRALPKEDRLTVNDLIHRCGREAAGLLNRLDAPPQTAILLREDPYAIDLGEVWEKAEVALFSLDSLGYPEQARLVGRLFVLDLKAAAARMLAAGRPVFVVLDEFGVLAGRQVADLLNKSRAAGMHLILAVQELADLRAGGGKASWSKFWATPTSRCWSHREKTRKASNIKAFRVFKIYYAIKIFSSSTDLR